MLFGLECFVHRIPPLLLKFIANMEEYTKVVKTLKGMRNFLRYKLFTNRLRGFR